MCISFFEIIPEKMIQEPVRKMRERRRDEREQRTLGGIKCKLEERAVKVEADSDETPGRGAHLQMESRAGWWWWGGGWEDTWLHRFGFSRDSVEMALLAPRGTFNTLIHRTHTSAPPLLHLHHSQASAAGRRLFFLICSSLLLCIFLINCHLLASSFG